MPILGFLMSKVGALVMAGVAAIALVGVTVQTVRIGGVHLFGMTLASGLQDQVATLNDAIDNPKTGFRHSLDVCHTSETNLSNGIDKQNAAIEKAHQDGIDAGKAAQAEVDAARPAMISARAVADQILKFQRKPGENACDAAGRLIRENVQ